MALRLVDEKIRVYVLSDDYRWHFVSDSFEEFTSVLAAYAQLMSKSQKGNNYHVKNLFLDRPEYEKARALIEGRANSTPKIDPPKRRPDLQIV